jgi:steroid 5-alpha reductase family enzyme
MLSDINQWFLALGAEYGVNPYIFGAIYVGAIPFFLASIAWLVKRARAGRSTVVPTLLAGFFFVSAYLYLAFAGRNIPVWVWIFLAVLVIYGARYAPQDRGEGYSAYTLNFGMPLLESSSGMIR